MFEQLANLYRGLSTARRASLLGVTLALGGGLTWLATQPARVQRVPVQAGRTFSGQELAAARKRLAAAQIRDYEVLAGQILVPASDAARFDAALAAEPGPAGWAGAWQQANDSLSPFASGRQQHDAREIARARLISELLQQLPDVKQAEVVWDEEPRIGWRQPPRVRATVYLQPRERREITLDTVDAVRRAVAGSKAHLDPADVVVMDLRRMTAYGRQSDEAGSGLAEQRLAALTAACRRRIEDALSDFEGVHVAVIVEPRTLALTTDGSATTLATAAGGPVVPRPRRAGDEISGPRGGPNQRLAVDPAPPEAPAPVISEASAATTPAPATSAEAVRAIVSLPPDYVRDRAIERDTSAAFARRTPSEQQSLLTELERTIVNDIRERVARIVPGATGPGQAAFVEVQTHETRIAAASPDGPPFGAARSALATLARWDRPTQWAIGGLIGYLLLWPLVRAVRHQRKALRPPKPPRPVDDPIAGLDLARRDPSSPPDNADASPHEQADRLLARLNDADPSEWRFELAGSPPDVIGALLPRLEPDRVTSVMAALSPASQQQALAHLAGLGPSGQPPAPRAGPLHRVAPSTVPLSGDPAELDDADPALLRTLFARLPGEVWSTALMGASAAFRIRLLSALPAADAAALRQSLTRQRPARLRDIETAQQQVLGLLHERGAFASARSAQSVEVLTLPNAGRRRA